MLPISTTSSFTASLETFGLNDYGEHSEKLAEALGKRMDAHIFSSILEDWKEVLTKELKVKLMAICVNHEMLNDNTPVEDKFKKAMTILHRLQPVSPKQGLFIDVCQVAAFGRVYHKASGRSAPYQQYKNIFMEITGKVPAKRKKKEDESQAPVVMPSTHEETSEDPSTKRARVDQPSSELSSYIYPVEPSYTASVPAVTNEVVNPPLLELTEESLALLESFVSE